MNCTFFGLIVAIPMLVFFSILMGRTQALINDMNETSVAVLNLVVASAYIPKLISNPQISRYLERHHPEILGEFRAIVAASSLEEIGAVAAAAQ